MAQKVLFVVVEDKAFLIQRLNLALAVKEAGYDVYVASTKSEHSKEIEKLGFKYINTGASRKSKNPFKEILSIFKLYKIYRFIKPDIVHHISIKPVLYGSIAAKFAKVPKIINLINGLGYVFVEDYSFKRKLFKKFISLFYKFSLSSKNVRVIFQNPDDRNYFVENKIVDEEKCTVILGSGVDTEKFKPFPGPEGIIKVLFCSRMLWDKGIKYLIEASKMLKKDGVEFELTFAGEPDPSNPRSVTLNELNAWHNNGLINYIGFQNDMPKLLREHHIVVLPTYYREGVPLSLIEAASAGKAIITTDMPGCREIVKNEENGFLVKPKNSQDLYEKLKILIQSNQLRKDFSKESRKHVELLFSKEIVISATLSLYTTISKKLICIGCYFILHIGGILLA